jgi:3-hydroxyacyl-CoA dehydrogenase
MTDIRADRVFRRATVLGAGVMGRAIAAHLVNGGLDVLLLDVAATEPIPAEAQRGLTAGDRAVRDRLAREAIAQLARTRPAPLFAPRLAGRIEPGNLEDDLPRIAQCDWVIEAVVERLDVKRALWARIDALAAPRPVYSTNTSGISIAALAEGRSPEFQRRFLATHFFNPPRYMHLLELVPCPRTDLEVLEAITAFAERRLGKGVILAKDRPNFIANRIGAYGVMRGVQLMQEQGLTVEAVDALTGPLIGRPKTATFRTCDLVGLDIVVHVARNICEAAPNDPEIDVFAPAPVLERMVAEHRLGDKTSAGFYRKIAGQGGESVIEALDLTTFTYRPKKKERFPEIDALRAKDDLGERLNGLFDAKGAGAAYAWAIVRDCLRYAATVAAEVADDVASIDRAMRWGYGWDLGPFELWERLGLARVAARMEQEGRPAPTWVLEHIRKGAPSFYLRDESGALRTLAVSGSGTHALPDRPGVLTLRPASTGVRWIEGNSGASLWDLGHGALLLEFHSKLNTLGGDAAAMAGRAVTRAEAEFAALVVGNEGTHFSAGANLALLMMAAVEGEFDEIDLMVRQFQQMTMGLRRCARPVVVAPFSLTLGGGTEVTLHGDSVVAAAELYMGLVEVGVGLIPAGGGTKELYVRMLERLGPGADPKEAARLAFETIGMARVSGCAQEARELGLLREGDSIVMSRDQLLERAKTAALELAARGYVPPPPRTAIPVGGAQTWALLEIGLHNLLAARRITEHDRTIGRKLARILSGGDLPGGETASEQQLLDLEREAFLSLCGERKTLERVQHMLKTGKPLRN